MGTGAGGPGAGPASGLRAFVQRLDSYSRLSRSFTLYKRSPVFFLAYLPSVKKRGDVLYHRLDKLRARGRGCVG